MQITMRISEIRTLYCNSLITLSDEEKAKEINQLLLCVLDCVEQSSLEANMIAAIDSFNKCK